MLVWNLYMFCNDHYRTTVDGSTLLSQQYFKTMVGEHPSPLLLSLPSLLSIRPSITTVWFLQCLFLFSTSQTVGVTHWKLQGNAITPLATDLSSSTPQSDDLFSVELSTRDPEFFVLLRHATKLPSGSYSNRGSKQPSCPVVSVRVDGDKQSNSLRGQRQCEQRGTSSGAQENVKRPRNPDGSGPMSQSAMAGAHPSPLNCGEPVEFTVYDFLGGIARRSEHKAYPEPEVAMIFKKSDTDTSVDLFEVEIGLRKAYQENPESLTVLNQIGNFWRIKGNTQLAIECFRKALSISPDHPDLLLNLARVLFNLKFYDNAVFLAKRSLHMKSSDHHAWLQYFTLGEVYKALEKYEEAAFYFKKSLELNPGLHVAEMHLRELGLDQHHSVNAYTLLIICALICIVLGMIYYLIGAMSG